MVGIRLYLHSCRETARIIIKSFHFVREKIALLTNRLGMHFLLSSLFPIRRQKRFVIIKLILLQLGLENVRGW